MSFNGVHYYCPGFEIRGLGSYSAFGLYLTSFFIWARCFLSRVLLTHSILFDLSLRSPLRSTGSSWLEVWGLHQSLPLMMILLKFWNLFFIWKYFYEFQVCQGYPSFLNLSISMCVPTFLTSSQATFSFTALDLFSFTKLFVATRSSQSNLFANRAHAIIFAIFKFLPNASTVNHRMLQPKSPQDHTTSPISPSIHVDPHIYQLIV